MKYCMLNDLLSCIILLSKSHDGSTQVNRSENLYHVQRVKRRSVHVNARSRLGVSCISRMEEQTTHPLMNKEITQRTCRSSPFDHS